MKDEIKEILDFLKDKDDYIEEYGYEYKRISLEHTKILLDYITNLQTIEQQYSAILSENAELENKITNLQEENNSLKQMSKDTYDTSQEIISELTKENEELKKNQRYHKKFGKDYIFCLENDKETYKDYIIELQEELKSANDSITWWTNRFNAVQRDYEDYKSRCEKAIPMLKKLNIKLKDILKSGIDIKEISDIEKVLQGVGKDE